MSQLPTPLRPPSYPGTPLGIPVGPPRKPILPNWAFGTFFGLVAVGTYWYCLQKIGSNTLNEQIEAEAARQEAAERRATAN